MALIKEREDRLRIMRKNIRSLLGDDVKIVAKPNSVVSSVIGIADTIPVTVDEDGNANEYSYIHSVDIEEGGITYDEAIDVAAGNLAEAISDLHELSRQVINPLAAKISDRYENRLNTSLATQHDLVVADTLAFNKFGGVWDSKPLQDIASKYEGNAEEAATLAELIGKNPIPEAKTRDDVLKIVRTGSTNFDKQIADHFETVFPGDELIVKYNKYVTGSELLGSHIRVKHVTRTGMDRNDILLTYLALANFTDNYQGDALSVDPVSFVSGMAKLTNIVGSALASVYKNRESIKESGVLVYKMESVVNDDNGVTYYRYYINEEVYREYVAKGGSDEAILSGQVPEYQHYNVIMGNMAKYEEVYARRTSLLEANSADKTILLKRRLMIDSILDEMEGKYGEYVELCANEDVFKDKVRERVNSLTAVEFINYHILIRKIICNVFYPGTGASKFFDLLQAMESVDGEANVRENALQATLEFVGQWSANQVKVYS